MARKPRKAEDIHEKAARPGDRPIGRLPLRRKKGFYALEIKADDGQRLTASHVLGKVVIYLAGGKSRRASEAEAKRYFKALKKKEKEFFEKG